MDGWLFGWVDEWMTEKIQGQNATERVGIKAKLFCLFLPISLHPMNFLPCQFIAILKWKKKNTVYFSVLQNAIHRQIMIIQHYYVHDYH